MHPHRIVVTGAGVAGLTAVRTLRDEGFMGHLVLLGDEAHRPYARPPLSKKALAEGPAIDDVALLAPDDFLQLDVDRRAGVRANAVQIDERRIVTASGDALEYDTLIIATGARARIPAWLDAVDGCHLLRSLDDACRLHAALAEASDVVIVGAGFLGTELAAATRSIGCSVTLLDVQASPMQHQVGALVSQRLAALHRARGVSLQCGTAVERLLINDGKVRGVHCANGETLRADLVIVAAGAEPNVAWLEGSGIDLTDGVLCDAFCCAAANVYAAGDVANWPSARFGRRLRLEHQMNAVEQAAVAARNALGANEPYDPVPYFWSDQYDVKIQVHGLVEPGSSARVLHGSIDAESFVVGYVDAAGTLRGVLGWNAVRTVRGMRSEIGKVVAGIEASSTPAWS